MTTQQDDPKTNARKRAQANPQGHMPKNGAEQAQAQERAAVDQMPPGKTANLNEGGRTNDSRVQKNPKGAVHGVPQPALKGTWR